jgi:hypothetical protein
MPHHSEPEGAEIPEGVSPPTWLLINGGELVRQNPRFEKRPSGISAPSGSALSDGSNDRRRSLIAMNAMQAGQYLAEAMGLADPISAQRMWSLARAGAIPTVRLGRRVFFQSTVLDRFVSLGGTAIPVREHTPTAG